MYLTWDEKKDNRGKRKGEEERVECLNREIKSYLSGILKFCRSRKQLW